MQPINELFHKCHEQITSETQMGDTIDQGNSILHHIIFAKSLQWRDGHDLAVDVDDEHAGGGWSPPKVIPVAFPPPIFSGGSLLTLCFVVLCFSAASSRNSPGDYFYSRF